MTAPARLAETERRAAEHFAAVDPTALVLDQTDGWSVFSLRGDDARSVFAQLTTVPLPLGPTAFVQGAFAGGSAKILLVDGVIHVFVPSTLRHHVAGRLDDVCRAQNAIASKHEFHPTYDESAAVRATEKAFGSDAPTTSFNRGAATPSLR